MRHFEGQFSSKHKVDLRGRSRGEESREQILERTRLERKRRQQQKLEQKSATALQAFWRSRHAVDLAKSHSRQSWQAEYGDRCEHAARASLPSDVVLLAAACVPLLSCRDHEGRSVCCLPTGVEAQGKAVMLLRAKRLAYLCTDAVLTHANVLQNALPEDASAPDQSVLSILVATVEMLTDHNTYTPIFPGEASRSAAANVLEHLAPLFPRLTHAILIAAFSQQTLNNNQTSGQVGSPAAVGSVSPPEQLLVSFAQQAALLAVAPAGSKLAAWMPSFLCIPLLWDRYPQLKPIQSSIWGQVVAALHDAGSTEAFLTQLPTEACVGGRGCAAAALLGNLAQAAGPSLEDKQLQTWWPRLAVEFASVMVQLMAVVPLQKLFDADQDVAMEDDDDIPAVTSMDTEYLQWDAPPALAAALATQVQCMSDKAFLKPVVSIFLPFAAATPTATSMEPATGRSWAEHSEAVCRLCALLSAMLSVPALRQNTLIVLAINVELVPRMWFSYLKVAHAHSSWQPSKDEVCDPGWMLPLVILARTYSTFLSTFGDDYMYRLQRPLPLHELYESPHSRGLVSLLKFALWQVLWAESQPSPGPFSVASWSGKAASVRQNLIESAGILLGQLYDRNCRRAFAPDEAFQTEHLPPARFLAEVKAAAATLGGLMEAKHTRVWAILTHAPFLVPFQERARVFQTVISADRRDRRELSAYGPQSFATIRRSSLMQDGFQKLNLPGEALRGRIRIQYVDHYGEIEAGVDGGGLFKDFMEVLIKEAFDPQIGLFNTTPDQKLYPNSAAAAVVPDAYSMFEFLGKMLGKALYEGILLELPLAGFFLKKLLRRGCDLNDLPSLDAELHRSLLILRDYDGDVEDLALSFTLTDEAFGANCEIELVPGGRDRPVTNNNRLEYIHRVANFKLNTQIKKATDAFRKGLEEVIACEWINMFNEGELQALIGGGDHQGLDLEDMKQHVNYAGGYHAEHPVIVEFWKVLEGFTPEQQKAFLRFVTACSRPPLLGFKFLDPALCVQMAGSVRDNSAQDRLPSSSTCINLLKLPPYRSASVIAEKLLLAVNNVAGFDLS